MTAESSTPFEPDAATDPAVVIVACHDGPLLVRGAARIENSAGEPVTRSRRTVALCRCGVSSIKPYCDGTHKLIGFRTEPQLDSPA
jgi:CDGSH-type Zn-finger protein